MAAANSGGPVTSGVTRRQSRVYFVDCKGILTMTGIAHTELKEVNKCHFLTTKGPYNSYIELLTIVSYNSLNKYPTFVQPFPRKMLLYSIFSNEWKSVKLSLLVLTPLPIHITTRTSGNARGSVPEGVH